MITVEFCGELYELKSNVEFVIGRKGDLEIDDNPFMHRKFLTISFLNGLWWIKNCGSQIAATISTSNCMLNSWLPPGSILPIVFGTTRIFATAGKTTYEFNIYLDEPLYSETTSDETLEETGIDGTKTLGHIGLTFDHKLLLIVLCEPFFTSSQPAKISIPTSQEAASRLNWTSKKFERKLDNLCLKLSEQGIMGLYGEEGQPARFRKNRLVEYALACNLVSPNDIKLLDELLIME